MLSYNQDPLLNSRGPSFPPFQPSGSEAAKFRLWVKSKGFTLGPAAPPLGRLGGVLDGGEGGGSDVLYLPTGTDKVSETLCVAPRQFPSQECEWVFVEYPHGAPTALRAPTSCVFKTASVSASDSGPRGSYFSHPRGTAVCRETSSYASRN